MKSTFGNHVTVSIFGESHGQTIGCVVDGLAPGIRLDLDYLRAEMEKRKAFGRISTARQEKDEVEIVSGFFNGYTTGTPLCMLIHNQVQHSKDYEATRYKARPSHADYTAQVKYLGYQDYRGGGHFSGRITAPVVAAGAICRQILAQKGIHIGSHLVQCKNVYEDPFSQDVQVLTEQIHMMNRKRFAALSEDKEKEMTAVIEHAAQEGNSVGGVLETAVIGVPAGIGEPFFQSVESEISHLLFSIPAIKGVEFGIGFAFADLFGSEANDPFRMDAAGKVITTTNHNGGINGGITNGMPIVLRSVVKPTASIYKTQQTIDMQTMENTELNIVGRHDPAIVHRARVVVDAMVAIALVDLFADRYGYLWMREETCVSD